MVRTLVIWRPTAAQAAWAVALARADSDQDSVPLPGERTLVMGDGVRVSLPAGYFFEDVTVEGKELAQITHGDPVNPVSLARWDYSTKPPAVVDWDVNADDETAFESTDEQLRADAPADAPADPQPGEVWQKLPDLPRGTLPEDATPEPYDPAADLTIPSADSRTFRLPGGDVTLPPGFTVSRVHADFPRVVDADGSVSDPGGGRDLLNFYYYPPGAENSRSGISWRLDTGEIQGERIDYEDAAAFDALKEPATAALSTTP